MGSLPSLFLKTETWRVNLHRGHVVTESEKPPHALHECALCA